MRLSCKHANQQSLSFADFGGGLNSTAAQEMIAENELSRVLNMEADHQTKLLKVVDGCKNLFTPPTGTSIKALMYDIINRIWLVADSTNKVYTIDLTAAVPSLSATIGTLTGTLFPVYVSWESGIIIASGGHLQYYNGAELKTLTNSPAACSAVYVKSGRILTNDWTSGKESNIIYSNMGDEETWTDYSNDDSSSKWTEVGYKDGGKIIAFVAMSQDVVVIKNNKCVYRLTGDYPNWSVLEISRNVDCSGRLCFYPEGTAVYVVGNNQMQYLDTGQFYGDIKASDVATKVTAELRTIDVENPRMIYVPPLNQVWIPLAQRYVLIYDCTLKSFYKRRFVDEGIVDVVSVGTTVFVVRPSSVCRLTSRLGYDNGKQMQWYFTAKRYVSHNRFLVKRVQSSITPYFDTLIEGNLNCGGIMLPLPTPYRAFRLWHNYSALYHNRRHVCAANERSYNLYDTGVIVYENFERLWHNYSPLYNAASYSMNTMCVNNTKTVAVSGSGEGCSFTINSIDLDIAEV